MVLAVAPQLPRLLRWRAHPVRDLILAITPTGHVLISTEDGIGEEADEQLAAELLADIKAKTKYDASLAFPPCAECGDDRYLEDEYGVEAPCSTCTVDDPDDREPDDIRPAASDLSDGMYEGLGLERRAL